MFTKTRGNIRDDQVTWFTLCTMQQTHKYNKQCSSEKIENIIVKRRINVSFVFIKMLPGNWMCTNILLICCTNDKLVFSVTVFSITVTLVVENSRGEVSFESREQLLEFTSNERCDCLPWYFFLVRRSMRSVVWMNFCFCGVVFYFRKKVQKTILFRCDLVQRRGIWSSKFLLELDCAKLEAWWFVKVTDEGILEHYTETLSRSYTNNR